MRLHGPMWWSEVNGVMVLAKSTWWLRSLGTSGLETMPVVAGERITDEAAELARARRVWQALDGRVTAHNGHELPHSASS